MEQHIAQILADILQKNTVDFASCDHSTQSIEFYDTYIQNVYDKKDICKLVNVVRWNGWTMFDNDTNAQFKTYDANAVNFTDFDLWLSPDLDVRQIGRNRKNAPIIDIINKLEAFCVRKDRKENNRGYSSYKRDTSSYSMFYYYLPYKYHRAKPQYRMSNIVGDDCGFKCYAVKFPSRSNKLVKSNPTQYALAFGCNFRDVKPQYAKNGRSSKRALKISDYV